ncbi:hypothetical protein AB0883_16260 [Micromonospora sp. NPDC047812]|uniref:hypothetical protein n=1 Tax=Micromonospora sp. NPDC047812 TaxID=3155742 RepID=UPI0034542E47
MRGLTNRLLAGALAAAATLLPRADRARWREEALAVLLDAPPSLRYRYALDTLVKLPVLAWQQRLAARPAHPPLSWPVSACAGAGLLAVPVVMVAALALGPVIGEDDAEFFFLVSPCGMLPAVAASCFHRARQRGGGARRHLLAALVALFAGTGPVAAGALGVGVGAAGAGDRLAVAVALVAGLAPGGWLLHTGAGALLRRRGPTALGVLGAAAGTGLLGVPVGLYLGMVAPALGWLGALISALSLLVLVPSFAGWSVWAGVRLLAGRSEPLTR